MEWVNITAKSLPEAIDLALDNLGVDEAEAEIEVLEEPRQGLFGRTRGNARVRARVKPKGTRPKVERGRSRKRGAEGAATGSGGGSRGGEGGSRSGTSGNRSRSRNGGSGPARDDEGAVTTEDSGETRADSPRVEVGRSEDAPRSERGERSGDRGRGGRSGGRSRGDGGSGSGNRSSSGERQSREPVEEASMEEVSTQLEVFLSGLTQAFGFDGGVTVASDNEDGLVGSVDGRHGLMVGPRARTLDAIQELARVSVQRSAPSSIRIKVDVGGYRELRKEALRTFALEAAAAVRLDGRERSLEPMSSADRKIVHDTLSEEPGIETRSAGNEPNRRVVVMAAAGSRSAAGPAVEEADETDEVVGGDEVEVESTSLNGDSAHGDEGADNGAEASAEGEGEAEADEQDPADEDDRVER